MRGHEAADWYRLRAIEATDLANAYEGLVATARQLREQVATEEVSARTSLAEAYLVELTPQSLERLGKLTGFNGFKRRSPIKAMEHESKVLKRRIAEIVADERYQRRQWLVGPDGEITRGRAEAWEMFEPWQRDAVRYEDLDGFMDLIDSKYDTPAFEHEWWQPSYWRRWAAGDRICEELGVGDFGDDILPEYTRIAAERDKWKDEVKRWDDRIDAIHALVQEHDESVARIPRLPEIYLESSHTVIAGFLEHADAGLLDQWCMAEDPPDRGVRMGLRRVAGLRAKLEFFDELVEQGLEPAIQGFKGRASKYQRKVLKYRRSKHYSRNLSAREIDHGFLTKQPKYNERIGKLDKLMRRLESYDRYERFELSNEPELWWVEMTRKQPSSFTPRLRTWYQNNQGFTLTHDASYLADDLGTDVEGLAGLAAADAVGAEDDLGYMS